MDVPDDSETGYILKVGLEYPDDLHDNHSDYPLAPENKIITEKMLSSHTIMFKEKLALKGNFSKLVADLNAKTNYVLHYRNLKYYLSKGLKLTKIHRVLEFTKSPWLKSYIDFNIQKQALAQSNFEKDF